jgi:glycine/D-amino acid oxidase-like deaminating enzyme/nitrite reductase/ring-hydroxylating ferredoxin subunit
MNKKENPTDRGNQRSSVWTQMRAPMVEPFAPLNSDSSFDVAIVGGGIAGVTAALLLKRAGKKVALLESDRIASGDTSRTSAHLTEVLDQRFFRLIEDFGESGARLAAEGGMTAIDRIETFCYQLSIDCDFERVPAFLFAETLRETWQLRKELKSARKIGVAASWVKDLTLMGDSKRGSKPRIALRIENQARIHPVRYVAALAHGIEGGGSHVFEHTPALEIKDGEPCRIRTPGGSIRAADVIVLTHSPVSNRFVLQTKIAAYRTYVIAARLNSAAKVEDARALYWDLKDPYHYLRFVGDDLLLIGGEDHKTGMKCDSLECFSRLELWARERFDLGSIEQRWSGQVHESVDGLPFIGRNPTTEHLYVGTGFSGNGLTWGTLAAMITSDAILGIANPYADLFHPSRVKVLASIGSFIAENAETPACFLGDRIARPEAANLADIAPGEGKLMKVDGKKVAVYRAPEGDIKACSAVCPQMGCHVRWNNAESSWDCPCHGSRFDTDGQVLNGPSRSGLAKVPLEEVQEVGTRKNAA